MDARSNNYKLKYSNFHVTVNLNVDSERHIGAMRDAVEEMVYDPWLWKWLKQYKDGERRGFKGADKMDVDRVRVRASFEHGGAQNHGLHVHLVIEIAHRTMVQIDKYGIDEVFQHFTKLRPNTHVRFLKGSGEDLNFILHYVNKEVKKNIKLHQMNQDTQLRSLVSIISGSEDTSSRSEQLSSVVFASEGGPADGGGEPYAGLGSNVVNSRTATLFTNKVFSSAHPRMCASSSGKLSP